MVENRIGNTAEVTVTIYDEDTYESMQAERYWNGNAGWQKINGKWYYFSDDGWVRTGWVCDTDGRWYYMNNDGSMATGWFKPVTSPRWYYLDPANGHMLTSCWIQDKDSNCWYYLNEAGVMCTGWLLSGNTWYLLDDNGAMCTGWNIVNGRWYYLNQSGAMLTGWQEINGFYYYMDENGACLINTTTPDGHRLDESGRRTD